MLSWFTVVPYEPAVAGAGLALLMLAAGWFIATLARGAMDRGLRRVHFDEVAERSGIGDVLSRTFRLTERALLAGLVYWTLLATSAVASARHLGVARAHDLVPRMLSAGFVLLFALLIFTFVAALVAGGPEWAAQVWRRRRR